MTDISLRQAYALIRKGVRVRLEPFKGRSEDIWCTSFFVDRLDLASVVFDYQHVHASDGKRVRLDELLAVVQDEFTDFLLVEDYSGQLSLSPKNPIIACENCGQDYEFSGQPTCQNCGHANLFQIAERRLSELDDELNPTDPLVRNIMRTVEVRQVQRAYTELVSCFETYFKQLNLYLFEQSGRAAEALSRPNLFQNIGETQTWFVNWHGLDILDGIESDELRVLHLVFLARHVIIHNGGCIDEKYVRNKALVEGKNPDQLDDKEIAEAIGADSTVVTTKAEIRQALRIVKCIIKSGRATA